MTTTCTWIEIDPQEPLWPAAVEALWHSLGAPENPALFPDYFVKTTFVRMGGRLLELRDASGALLAGGLLFPRGLEGRRKIYTLRLHAVAPLPSDAALRAALTPLLSPDSAVLYHPERGRSFSPGRSHGDDLAIGPTTAADLPGIRALRQAIWAGGPGENYPADLHSAEFAPATTLVARQAGRVAGFLFGFYRFGDDDSLARLDLPYGTALRVESQTMGVDPSARRFGLAARLKRAQAEGCLNAGIDIIHWTADPLQFPNAALNFSRLRAVSGAILPHYYPFQNALNRVAASRLVLTWLPRSARGRAGLDDAPRNEGRDLARFPGCALLNDALTPLGPPIDAPHLALEIPPDWTALQHGDPERAIAWRTLSDRLLDERLGFAPGRYLVGDTASAGERRYLVLHRFDMALLTP